MAFNIILICLYHIDVGTIPWRSLESRGILDLWELKKASLSAIKLQLFKITSFWIVKKHFIGLSPPFIVDHTFDCNYHCIPTYYRNFGISRISSDSVSRIQSENQVHDLPRDLQFFACRSLYIGFEPNFTYFDHFWYKMFRTEDFRP